MDDNKPLCKYSPRCYQKNPEHLKKYKHPPVKNFKIFDFAPKTKKLKLDECATKESAEESIPVSKDKPTVSREKSAEELNDEIKPSIKENVEKKIDNCPKSPNTSNYSKEKPTVLSHSTSKNEKKPLVEAENHNKSVEFHDIPDDVPKFIEDTFLVKMPEDFFGFWEFYSKNVKIAEYMRKVNLDIVGPYDVLLGKLPIREDKTDYLLHWRHFFDPPEFQTVIMSTKSEYHIGYFRDSPADLPCFVASNDGINCKIQPLAENIFGALLSFLNFKLKSNKNVFLKSDIDNFVKDLKQFANENKYSLDSNTPAMKNRRKNTVAKTFHEAYIVVPLEKRTKLGYRPLIEKDVTIKAILKNLAEAESDKDRDSARAALQPIVTMANIATDECDFGTGLELGIDFFCFGEPILHNYAKSLLSIAYNMLNRHEFGEIIKAHLKNRRKGSKLSVADL